MIAARTLDELRDTITGSCVTIGNFDGVHLGHQRLIARTCAKARARGLVSVVVTFDPHPMTVLMQHKTPPFLTSTSQRLRHLERQGPNVALVLEFTREMASLEPEEFVQRYLLDGLSMRELVIGYDYAMGKGRRGDHDFLAKLGQEIGFGVERLDPVIVGGAVVSSTRIRDLIQSGNVWDARPLLGRFFEVEGEVVDGMKRGAATLGFPTANLKLEGTLLPRPGVYAVWAELDGEIHQAVANVGDNPTFGDTGLTLEAHVLDFNRRIYGERLRLHFVQRLRGERKFESIAALKNRIADDVRLGRVILDTPDAQLSAEPGLAASND
ncbi:riboflavin kinase / FMN adenylyltransferase [Humidesulfovibrio mexicanus]|uniref:Riboflavin biosynthesis protein n=1 Tax=Humidesulfovibrio mexicanus TaxID=147047 RepID=A0A238XMB7_9BACT|nr:bifunctional riboflavin kinase/FAD synthetase [Humidesulfovibrio mexicanus]SNR59738.1 riboflavin kinase / FMN adenylyltransferase [Humidesulfovibrio mexicanus]